MGLCALNVFRNDEMPSTQLDLLNSILNCISPVTAASGTEPA